MPKQHRSTGVFITIQVSVNYIMLVLSFKTD